MALILAMQAGRSMYVGKTRVEVLPHSDPHDVHVRVHGDTPQDFHLNRDMRVQVLPDVFMAVGSGSGKTMIKLAIEAPRSIEVLRDSLYEAGSDRNH